ncbi:hypothetical protein CAC42_3969 [Sphaceloma murrayae]|uniref:Uncharacterized protein n=1 Tax=Sphaceloma murrayae TaxID=2082308 RepID=A0A2K1QSV7_9PEZI|nr:hypothetical protein CAC42_3969 [Sphaceloma murrayae]
MEAFSVPTVTEDDLRAFHAKHFTSAHLPKYFFASDIYNAYDDDDEDDDGLGWYSDGAKRRITDEQIAIFRHSELFRLMREREIAEISDGRSPAHSSGTRLGGSSADHYPEQVKRAAYSRDPIPLKLLRSDEGGEPNAPRSSSNGITEGQAHNKVRPQKQKSAKHSKNWRKKRNLARRKRLAKTADQAGHAELDQEMPSDEDADADQRDRNIAGSGKRKWTEHVNNNPGEAEPKTHRRVARELDELKIEAVELSYDD